jgi:DHA1 family bicyclomycin/chloramphenicol resistance-like MFS transporter
LASGGSAQMTLSTYILGFALGQLLYGPMADSLGRKPVILGGTLVFAAAAVACALAQTIDHADCHAFLPRSGGRGGQRGD